ncbi:hypothetical protein [Azohydromonas lata]|uniref:Uncharacterized protein n=1 Tax=Azohydromonas lata TaxID=45677 RepID=A0ABU5IMG8_9BURK|nr:hypothetical protein [Azohydromonas lata]MDZ5460085.1 hypothetical protein [Azohydromonas lata]
MPLFLNEVWLGDVSPKVMDEAVTFFGNLSVGEKPRNLPNDLRMVAGPWLSAEEAKVMFIFEIDDPSTMFDAFAERMVSGLFARRKLTLLSDWDGLKAYADRLNA